MKYGTQNFVNIAAQCGLNLTFTLFIIRYIQTGTVVTFDLSYQKRSDQVQYPARTNHLASYGKNQIKIIETHK